LKVYKVESYKVIKLNFENNMKKNLRCFRRLFILSVVSLFMIANVQAQMEISGTVTDNNGETLVGVSIMVKGTTIGAISDINGNYRLTVNDDNATLIFSYVGYLTEEVPLVGRRVVNITMKENAEYLDEVVVVGYGTQVRQSVTGAVSQISGKELLKAPVGNISTRLGGVIPGMISLQQSGQPGADGASILVRGSSAKYIVDGVQRQFAEIDPNDIATISVLKDAASAAVYGLDANSVVIITTKRGNVSPSRISFTASHGISVNSFMLEMLNGPEYAYWYNLAREMDGDTPIFSLEHVEKMIAGEDGWGNTNWYKKTFGTGHNTSYNINATGGTEKIKYFVSLGNFKQDGNVRNFIFNRYNLRSNIDATIAQNLELSFNVSGRVEDRKRPLYSAVYSDWNNIPQQAIRMHPYVSETWEGEPISTRTASTYINPLAATDLTGYNNIKANYLETNVALNYKVPFVTGLSVRFMGAYDISYNTTKIFSTPYYTYVANRPTSPSDNLSFSYTYDARGVEPSLAEGLSQSTHFTTNTSIKYENSFGRHNISALALFESVSRYGNSFAAYGYGFDFYNLDELSRATLRDKNEISGSSYQQRVAGFLGRINYSYHNRYLAELTMRYDGSYVFAGFEKGKRWAPFPAASIGWRISEEDWFRNIDAINFVNHLKLRGSVGLTSSTAGVSPYSFLNTLSLLSNAVVVDGKALNGLNTSSPANTKLTWPKSLQYNAGFEATMWRGLLGVEFDVFYKYMFDIIASPERTYPPSYGGYAPSRENVDKQDHKGFEILLSHRKSFGDFFYKVAVNGTYTLRRWLKSSSDSPNTPDWLKVTGKEMGAQLGFISLGLFQSEEEIANSALIPGCPVKVGDIKYLDRNGDGVITHDQDYGYIGKSAYPKFVGGFSFETGWKGIDLSFLLQGALGRHVALTGVYDWQADKAMDNTSMTRPFYHDGNSPKYLLENSWREDLPSGEFPRLTIGYVRNNAFTSNFWYRNGNYIRLKTAQIGYTFPQKWMNFAGFYSTRFYLEGQNLLTYSGLSKYSIDPEQPGVSSGYYPQQRIISFGVNVTF